MIHLTLDTKKCMSKLLLSKSFSSLLFIEGEITTFNKFTLDGYIQKDFFEEPSDATYSTWEMVREYCLSIIKGKRTPLNFKFIFSLDQQMIEQLILKESLDFQPNVVQGCYLNFQFNGSKLTCITGTSLKTFTLDKSMEHAFDRWTRNFFTGLEIPWDES